MTDSAKSAEPTDCTLLIEGMTCAACVRRVERALQKVPGVEAAAVNLVTGKARVIALLVFGDALKPTAAAAIDALRMAGIRTVLLTGDQPEAALSVASRLGIDEWHASLLPADKLTQLARLRTNRAVVAGAAMAFSSVSVVANALRLRHWQAGLKRPG